MKNIIENRLPGVTVDKYISKDHARGRIEIRTCYSISAKDWIDERRRWKNLASISVIISERIYKNKTERSYRYYISNFKPDAELILHYIRRHWAIENQCHRTLNVNFQADQSRIRDTNSARNFSIIRDFSMAIIEYIRSKLTIAEAQSQIAYSFKFLKKIF